MAMSKTVPSWALCYVFSMATTPLTHGEMGLGASGWSPVAQLSSSGHRNSLMLPGPPWLEP